MAETLVKDRPTFEKSQDRLVIEDMLRSCEVGQIVTYDEITEKIGRDVRQFCQGILTGARDTLLKDDRYVFTPIVNVGLKRMTDSEIVADSENDISKQRRAANRSMRKLSSVEYDKLSQEDKLRHCAFATQAAVIRELSSKSATKRIEGKVAKDGAERIPVGKTLELFVR